MKRYINFFLFFILFLSFKFAGSSLIYRDEKFSMITVDLPLELQNKNLIKNIILEDINGDDFCDLIIFFKNIIYIFEQEKISGFSECYKLSIDNVGAIDIGNVMNGNDKEILIMHKEGISYLKKENEKWNSFPIPLINKKTIYFQESELSLVREYFVIDLDEDNIPELILWGKKKIYIYYKTDKNEYELIQSIPYESKDKVISPGLIISYSPWKWRDLVASKRLFEREWPNRMKFIYLSTIRISNRYLIMDFNRDLRKDLILIKQAEEKSINKGSRIIYKYQIYLLNEDKMFSRDPDITINDVHGVWISPICVDIDNNGFLDLLTIKTEVQEGIIKKQKSNLLFYLANKDGGYPTKPSYSVETNYFPLLNNTLVDINGDNKKDLILIHPIIKGFSIGSIIKRFLQKGINAEIWVLPFKEKHSFSKKIMMKKIKVEFFMGSPINISGDFNGDGKKDLLIIDGNKIKIFPLVDFIKGFSKRSYFNIKIKDFDNYVVKDVNNNKKSDLIILSNKYLNFILF